MISTLPAPTSSRSGTTIPGTIGFDLYLALLAPRLALRAPRLPKF